MIKWQVFLKMHNSQPIPTPYTLSRNGHVEWSSETETRKIPVSGCRAVRKDGTGRTVQDGSHRSTLRRLRRAGEREDFRGESLPLASANSVVHGLPENP